jgi:hypothetical protein
MDQNAESPATNPELLSDTELIGELSKTRQKLARVITSGPGSRMQSAEAERAEVTEWYAALNREYRKRVKRTGD